jgi:lipopolysaccharide transport system permease protein
MILGFNKSDIKMAINLLKLSIRDKYLGSKFGLLWAVVNPVLFLGLYTFIFGFVFKAKVPGSETTFAYAIFFISGFVPYLAISEGMNTTTLSVVGSASMVKNVVFKVECLPIASTLVAAVPFSVGMFFLGILLLIDGNYPTLYIIFLVPVIVLQFALLSGLGFFLSATTVFIRDIAQIIPTVTVVIVFFTPIFYSIDMLPIVVQKVTFLNPFHHIVQAYRDILLQHQLPDWKGILYLTTVTAILNLAGLWYFRRLKGYFTMAL